MHEEPNESIDVRVYVYETVDADRDEYQGRKDELAEKWAIRTVDVGVEGFGYNGGVTGVIFRDANVLGRVYHFYEYSNGQIGVAGEYARKMHQRWRDRLRVGVRGILGDLVFEERGEPVDREARESIEERLTVSEKPRVVRRR